MQDDWNSKRLETAEIWHITRPSLTLLGVAIDVSAANSANNHRPDILASIVSLGNGFSFPACKPSFKAAAPAFLDFRQSAALWIQMIDS
jgi:hypothetical protein